MKDALVTLVVLGELTGEEADGIWAEVGKYPPFLDPSYEAGVISSMVAKAKAARTA